MTERNQATDNGNKSGVLPLNRDDVVARVWPDLQFAQEGQGFPGEAAGGLVSLGFIAAALRRMAWLWCGLAVAGMLAGAGTLLARPAPDQASTSLLVANLPGLPEGATVLNDQAIVQSRTVASRVIRQLGLRESASSFLGDYQATVQTNQVLVITVRATSAGAALREANALAAALLSFQAEALDSQQQLIRASLQQQVNQAQQHVNSLSQQISQVSAQPASAAHRSELASLRKERSQAANALAVFKVTANGDEASTQTADAAAVEGSQVLDRAAIISQSGKKRLLLYLGAGLVGGLALGIGIVVIGALVSDRLRRRDDVAHVLGAPVKLSVGPVRVGRWRPGSGGVASASNPDVRRIVSYLRSLVSPSPGDLASLAVVPADDVQVPAICLTSLAVSCAQQGLRVVVADLCAGSPAARLLGAAGSGVQRVSADGVQLAVVVPESDDVVPSGPLSAGRQRDKAPAEVAAACASADLLLTLTTLDPALGGEHLPEWAASAVAVVTAGQSSAERVFAVGEMIRLARVPLISAVLVGADKADESLGTFEGSPASSAPEVVAADVAANAGSA